MSEHVVDHRLKLTDEDVAEIRRKYSKLGVLQSELARQYGVAQTTISQVVNFKIRREVSRVPAPPRRRPKRGKASARPAGMASEVAR